MTARALAATRGRPSIDRLQASLEDARSANGHLREVNVNLALELVATKCESKAFAQRVRQRIDRVRDLIACGFDAAALTEAGSIGYDADRRLEQLAAAR